MHASLRYSVGALGVVAMGLGAFALHRHHEAHAGGASAPAAAPVARLGLLHGPVDGETTEVAIATVGATKPLSTLGVLTHRHGSTRRGAMLPGREVAMVVVAEDGARHSNYGSALFRVERGVSTRLCGGVADASTPLVTDSGRVLIERGKDGVDPSDDEARRLMLRVDELTIDDVDPATGNIRTLWKGRGYQAYLGAMVGGSHQEAAVYLSTPGGSSIFALDPVTSTTRTLAAAVPPWARDFSWDAAHGALVFVNLVAPKSNDYRISSLDLSSGATRSLLQSSNEHSMPFAIGGGDVALSSDGDHGLAIFSPTTGRLRSLTPLGDGSDAATHVSPDGRWIAVRHTPISQSSFHPPQVVAIDVVTATVEKLGTPAAHAVQPIGFLAGGAP